MELKKTPLYEAHKALGAKIVPFAGWQMPVQYASLIEEHIAVRQRCGLFDVSHMGEIEVSGRDALRAVERLTTNNASRLIDGGCQYTLVCNEKGGVVDDVFLYRISKERFMFCVNADNADKIYEWIKKNTRDAANVKNLSDDYAQLALQGPFSERILAKVSETDPSAIKRNRFATIKVCGIETLVSRTGYTGEDGFELYIKPEGSEKVWSGLLQAGKEGRDSALRPRREGHLAARDGLSPLRTRALRRNNPYRGRAFQVRSRVKRGLHRKRAARQANK